MVNVYADTSVIGGCYDIEFREWSMALFEEFKTGTKRIIISDLVTLELTRAREEVHLKLNEVPLLNRRYLATSDEAIALANTYINEGALSNKCFNDALHIALATLNNADVLASWNFKHIVNLNKIRLYNSINMRLGHRLIEIRTPREIIKVKENEES
jgi:predicted nucleic acid-binding protein